MIREIVQFLKFFSLVILGATLFGLPLVSAIRYGVTPNIDNVPIIVEVEGQEVYRGKSYLCNVHSLGATTHVSIKNDDWLMTPKAYYVSDEVRVYNQ